MKQPFLYKIIGLAIGFLSIVSCTDNTTEEATFVSATEYYPLAVGNYIEYKLDSTIYSDFDNSATTRSYFIKNKITGTITDGENDKLYEVKRYIKPADNSSEYKYEYSHFVKEQRGRIETIENQLRFISLVSPIVEGKTWEGNEYISFVAGDNPNTSTEYYKDWNYEYVSVNEDLNLTALSGQNVIHINQSDLIGGPGAINHYVSNEYYAEGIGLVKKQMEILVENCGDVGCSEKTLPILQRTKGRRGYTLDMEMIDYKIN